MAEAASVSGFGRELRQCRQAAGLSLRQLAARVGYDHSYLSQVERGRRPGSADLARLCDRELGTGGRLTRTYLRAHPKRTAAVRPVGLPAASLAAVWDGLTSALTGVDCVEATGDVRSVPPARLLPELLADLQLLQAQGPDGFGVRAAELSVLVAETLTGLGELRAARRWWSAARAFADSSGEVSVRSLVRAREAVSGLAELRPPLQLLELADESLALAQQIPASGVQAHAVRARVLAQLGRRAEAHRALQELLSCSDALPPATTSRLGDLAPYEVHAAEGTVCASLGYGTAGCLMLGRALELCPEQRIGERAQLELALAECLALEGEVAAGLALAMRVLVELPDEWHTYYLYDEAGRVLAAARDREPGLAAVRDLEVLVERRPYATGRSVGSGSW
ncbi:XRE family transcriptional regulator [Kribbella capetownensis]|uniref:XRE family transcriptional regulator n=1 Tax=Kribbella capetownensis TaxID=1572659 RepID=A0A4R0JW64_9ACTN|nr:helix-turn-helix transcriptional regulator [Kribbella capetownensis]TCC46525.1 XRE family transcriptional regulator [Kribbella capetownensis]